MTKEAKTIIGGLVVVFVTVIFAVFAVMVVENTRGSRVSSPQQAFEAHLLALDEGRLDDALSFVDVDACGTLAVNGATDALEDLKQYGYTFSTTFLVDEVWFLEDDTEAILQLDPPERLPVPSTAHMRLVGGEWKLTCG